MRILCTGHPLKRLAASLAKQPFELIDFASRETNPGFDLKEQRDRERLAELSLNYDVFINNSFIDDFVQVYLAKEVWTLWMSRSKAGQILNLGSAVEDLVRPDNRLYSIGKKALRDYSTNLNLFSLWHDSKIKVSHISFGGIATDKTLDHWPHFNHLDPDFCAEQIFLLLQSKNDVSFDVIKISPVQPKDKKLLKKEIDHPKLPKGEFLVSDS